MNTDIIALWLPLIVAVLVQAAFAAPLGSLVLLIAVGRGQRQRESRLNKFGFSFLFGATMFLLLLFVVALEVMALLRVLEWDAWTMLAIYSGVVGLLVLLFYYRKGKAGTSLWLPRRMTQWLQKQIEADKSAAEAFVLGALSVVFELLLSLAPLLIAANVLVDASDQVRDFTAIGYVIITMLPLFILIFMTASGEKLSAVQRWRETHKRFLQITMGVLLLLLSLYIIVAKVVEL